MDKEPQRFIAGDVGGVYIDPLFTKALDGLDDAALMRGAIALHFVAGRVERDVHEMPRAGFGAITADAVRPIRNTVVANADAFGGIVGAVQRLGYDLQRLLLELK